MAEFVHEDVVEQILVRSNVKDLIRFKSVCKPWHSLITKPRFINLHLNHSYHKDCYNNEFGRRRISLVDYLTCYFVVGSSNGLVCFISTSGVKLLVGNPLTRETRELKPPLLYDSPVCRGFGYDSSKDDCKLILGSYKLKNQTLIQVLSLKSNVWRVVGLLKYTFVSRDGVLCNGALHWIVTDVETEKNLIIAYDLSKDEFREISQPDDARYEYTSSSYLGLIKECLCICRRRDSLVGVWLMKKYNVKQSWEPLTRDRKMKYDIVHHLRIHKDCILPWSFSYPDESGLRSTSGDIDAPVYVQSLVSPW